MTKKHKIMTKFIELDGFNGKAIINTASVSSVHEDSRGRANYITVKLTDGSTISVEMKIEDFHKLLTEGETSEPLNDCFK